MTAHGYTSSQLAECWAAASVASVESMSQGNYEMKKYSENFKDKVDQYAQKNLKKDSCRTSNEPNLCE
jgi:septal ring-binding cell division protein DamX